MVRLIPGPRPLGDATIYRERRTALKAAHAFHVSNFRSEWGDHKRIVREPDAFRTDFERSAYASRFRIRALRALATIRALKLAIRDAGVTSVRIRGNFSV